MRLCNKINQQMLFVFEPSKALRSIRYGIILLLQALCCSKQAVT